MQIVTRQKLASARFDVIQELARLGFLDEAVRAVKVELVTYDHAHGFQCYGDSGHIGIPRISASRILDVLRRTYTSLRDVLRHEYAHAIADTHRGLFRSRRFSDAFDGPHTWEFSWEYDPEHHVSDYAAKAPAEYFAEVFMFYVRHKGRLPAAIATEPILRKWRFTEDLGKAISTGCRRW